MSESFSSIMSLVLSIISLPLLENDSDLLILPTISPLIFNITLALKMFLMSTVLGTKIGPKMSFIFSNGQLRVKMCITNSQISLSIINIICQIKTDKLKILSSF